MTKRVTLEVVLILVITLVLAWLLLGLVSLVDYADPWWAAFLDEAPRMLFGVTAIALVLWAIMVAIGSIAHRNRGSEWRIGTHLVSLFVALLVNVLVFVGLAFANANANEGGWGLLLAGIALGIGLVVGVAGTVAVLLVDLVFLRQKKPVEPALTTAEAVE